MRRPKLVFPTGSFLFYYRLFCCRTIGGFSPCPHALGDFKFLPVLIGSEGFLRAEHHVYRNDDECRVGYRSVRPFYLGLIIFGFIDIFQDAVAIEMIALHLIL